MNAQVDGLRIALEMEKRGKGLYARAQTLVEDPEILALLKTLERDEQKHYAQFTAMMALFNLPPMTPEECALAAAKAADFFFPGGLMKVAMDGGLTSFSTMMNEAIQSERNAIAFYGQLLATVDDERMQDVILRIIREEMNHLRTLTRYQTREEVAPT